MDRKVILQRLEAHFGVKPKYMGTPSFAYQVKAGDETYTIDRQGKITNAEGTEVELEALVGIESKPVAPEVAVLNAAPPETEKPEAEMPDGMEVTLPMEGHTGVSLNNLVNMIAAKQNLIQQAFRLKNSIVDEEFVNGINTRALLTAEDFEAAALEIGADKCPGMTFDFKDRTITFKFYEGDLEPDKIKAYTDLVAIINKVAQNLKHASPKLTATDNPKYSFRTWLLRLGMIGDEYKATRKVLLKCLEGNGAFRKVGAREANG